MINPKLNEKIILNSVSLEKYGFNTLAWNKTDAKNLIHSIMHDKIGIFGGDVYKLTSHLDPLRDNWSCRSRSGKLETKEEYYLRSKTEPLKYIENYPVKPDQNILFSITFTEDVMMPD